ncbi:MAG: hypothetical protein HC836_27790 [Richelia sp. RM2_1_2]|nr:hypothetical protein [Richelia sp. RM2_1_2]
MKISYLLFFAFLHSSFGQNLTIKQVGADTFSIDFVVPADQIGLSFDLLQSDNPNPSTFDNVILSVVALSTNNSFNFTSGENISFFTMRVSSPQMLSTVDVGGSGTGVVAFNQGVDSFTVRSNNDGTFTLLGGSKWEFYDSFPFVTGEDFTKNLLIDSDNLNFNADRFDPIHIYNVFGRYMGEGPFNGKIFIINTGFWQNNNIVRFRLYRVLPIF